MPLELRTLRMPAVAPKSATPTRVWLLPLRSSTELLPGADKYTTVLAGNRLLPPLSFTSAMAPELVM